MSTRDKWVRRFTVDETVKHKNGFTIYKITSVLFPMESPEAVSVVSVWKRYSDAQRLQRGMRALHAGLHLRGACPALPAHTYFKRFHKEVIEERAKGIKALLEFVAEHQLLFTSTEFVNFLQTGYPEPVPEAGGVINAIRSSLHLPIEDTPPLEYHTDHDHDDTSPAHTARVSTDTAEAQPISADETDFISQIPIYEAADVEIRESPIKHSETTSFGSINSIESIDDDMYDELNKMTIDKTKPSVKTKSVLPDLINFDAPSTSKFEDYHTMPKKTDSDTMSLNSNVSMDSRRNSRVSMYSRSVASLSNVECKTRTEDSYVFEAGYMLNLAARCEDMGDHQRAFECYKSGIEKMLIGVQTDTDPQRRALIKEKTNKYLSYAEEIYKNHLCNAEQSLLPERDDSIRPLHCPIPISMLRRPYEDLSLYKVLAVLGSSMMLVLHRREQTCYAMKVIQKVPNNLTEFDEYFLQRTNETRQPVLPTVIPYMVPLHAYIETANLIFLILSYAPGQKLFGYIKNYTKSPTPAREVNLENVFTDPKNKNQEFVFTEPKNQELNDNIDSVMSDNNNVEMSDMSVKELVLNSQRLLSNVDKVLSDAPRSDAVDVDNASVVTAVQRPAACERGVLPPAAVCRWAAEILTALESLHNSGVVCRDLNPTNILLGDRGQIILTYFHHHRGLDMCLSKLHTHRTHRTHDTHDSYGMYVAPELHNTTVAWDGEGEGEGECACDYWSYGAVMYRLLCGQPLWQLHRGVFSSHTELQLPDHLPLEQHSLLTQLLTYEPSERLGAGKDGIEEIKRHPYFKHVDWRHVYDSWAVPD